MDGHVVDEMWLHGSYIPLSFTYSEGCLHNILVTSTSLICHKGVSYVLQLCVSCCHSLMNRKTLELVLVNHLYIGDISEELTGFTIVGETLIA